jgi:hypothetical protein
MIVSPDKPGGSYLVSTKPGTVQSWCSSRWRSAARSTCAAPALSWTIPSMHHPGPDHTADMAGTNATYG